MKWQKLGKIFNPNQHNLLGIQATFAQSPQALVYDEFVRIYFSTREKDHKGKFVSHIAFVDMDKSFKSIIQVSKHEVVALGKRGCFDEHGIFPISPVKNGDKIYAYTTGWNRKQSVLVDASIGLAISHDNGNTFEKYGDGPILTSTLNEPFLVGDAYVQNISGQFHMWYIFGTSWAKYEDSEQFERVYKIAHATSEDGINWTRNGTPIIADEINSEECQALPTVFELGGRYHMYFCYRHATGFRTEKEKGYRIGYAYSDDLLNWTRDDNNSGINVSESGWDSDMQCYPFTFKCDGRVYMLYNGNEFGKDGFGIAVLEQG